MFITLKKEYLGHKPGETLEIHEEPVAKALCDQGICEVTPGDPYGAIMAKATEAAIGSRSARTRRLPLSSSLRLHRAVGARVISALLHLIRQILGVEGDLVRVAMTRVEAGRPHCFANIAIPA